jgi:hypothetical protein
MMHAEVDVGSRKSSSKHIEAKCPLEKLRTFKAEQKSIWMISYHLLTEDLERRRAIIQKVLFCSTPCTTSVPGRCLGEQGRGRVCGIMRLSGAPRPGLNSDAPVSYIVHSV